MEDFQHVRLFLITRQVLFEASGREEVTILSTSRQAAVGLAPPLYDTGQL